MSRIIRNNNNKQSVSKPFCKICFDAGKPESQYTSHHIRKTTDPNSEITCPILLATECRYCHQFGHTISRCTLREQNNRTSGSVPRYQATRPVAPAPVAPVRGNNKFAAFEEDDEVEVPVSAPAPVDNFPMLAKMPAMPAMPAKMTTAYTVATLTPVAPVALTPVPPVVPKRTKVVITYTEAFKSSLPPRKWITAAEYKAKQDSAPRVWVEDEQDYKTKVEVNNDFNVVSYSKNSCCNYNDDDW